MGWIWRVRGLRRRHERESEFDEELRFHIAMREQQNLDQGMNGIFQILPPLGQVNRLCIFR